MKKKVEIVEKFKIKMKEKKSKFEFERTAMANSANHCSTKKIKKENKP